jgi:hypothetical protein
MSCQVSSTRLRGAVHCIAGRAAVQATARAAELQRFNAALRRWSASGATAAAGLPCPALDWEACPLCPAAGFPVTPLNFTLYGFSEVDGQGILGADFSCDGSVVPGACAFNSLVQALRECVSVVNCRSVVVYQNGAAACRPLAVCACMPACLPACCHMLQRHALTIPA